MLAKFFINFSSSLSYMDRTLDSRSSFLAKALTVNDSAICLCFRYHFDLLSLAIIGLGVCRSLQEGLSTTGGLKHTMSLYND